MNELDNSMEFDPTDALIQKLSAMQPAESAGFESRVMYSAGRADAIREFSARRKRQVWMNAAAMLLVAAGSSALTWNLSQREVQPPNNVATIEQPADDLATASPMEIAKTNLQPAVPSNRRTTADQSLNQLVDQMLRRHQSSKSTAWNLSEAVSSGESTQPVSTSPQTWMQLQQKLLNENTPF